MNEIELLRNLVGLEKQKDTLSIKQKIVKTESELSELEKEKAIIQKEIENVQGLLAQIEDKGWSNSAKRGMINQLREYVKVLNENSGKKLLRDQSTVIENRLFERIRDELKDFVTDEVVGHGVPLNLLFAVANEGENLVSAQKLADFLEAEIRLLFEIQDPDYIKLRIFLKDFEYRIIEQFIA